MSDTDNKTTGANRSAEEWVRLPARNCVVCGIKRSKLARLVIPSRANKGRPLIPKATMTLPEPGQKRAMRLIHLPSLIAYINAEAERQAEEAIRQFGGDEVGAREP